MPVAQLPLEAAPELVAGSLRVESHRAMLLDRETPLAAGPETPRPTQTVRTWSCRRGGCRLSRRGFHGGGFHRKGFPQCYSPQCWGSQRCGSQSGCARWQHRHPDHRPTLGRPRRTPPLHGLPRRLPPHPLEAIGACSRGRHHRGLVSRQAPPQSRSRTRRRTKHHSRRRQGQFDPAPTRWAQRPGRVKTPPQHTAARGRSRRTGPGKVGNCHPERDETRILA
mmetsp:Transcript_36697/g.117892  ORF Transcript_36697/g.117892 Transcript_36697/m.117892 type:complete len:223 (+) Transcript_36697:784-1452(+)